ncbi:MAG: hypothetical protein WDM79_00155 [Terricaulis sp.]
MLTLMFLAALGVVSGACVTVVFAILLFFMPLRRALSTALVVSGSAVIAGLMGLYSMSLFVDDELNTQGEFAIYFGGVGGLALLAALISGWACAKALK